MAVPGVVVTGLFALALTASVAVTVLHDRPPGPLQVRQRTRGDVVLDRLRRRGGHGDRPQQRLEIPGRRLPRGEDLLVIADRREAIAEAFRRAQPGDIVLLAGKGHETWNVGPNGPEPWSDRETALELLEESAPGRG